MRLVRYFVAVAEELHFGRAAARLHIAQPSLSHEVRRLEQSLGVVLLNRTSRRVELTEAGRTLLDQGRRLLAHSHRVVESTRAAARDRLTIGFYGSAAMSILPEIVRAFAERHPAIDVTVRELLFGDVDTLLGGEIDLAFTRLLAEQLGPEFDVEVLTGEPRLAALPRTHRLARRSAVTYADLSDEAFVTNPAVKGERPVRWLSEQRSHGLPGRVATEAASLAELLTVVAAGRGVSLVPATVAERYPRPDIRYVPVSDAEPAVLSVVRHRAQRRPAADAFIAVAREVAARPLPGPG